MFSSFLHHTHLTQENILLYFPPLLHQRRDAQWAAGPALDFHRERGDVAAGRGEFIQGCDNFVYMFPCLWHGLVRFG